MKNVTKIDEKTYIDRWKEERKIILLIKSWFDENGQNRTWIGEKCALIWKKKSGRVSCKWWAAKDNTNKKNSWNEMGPGLLGSHCPISQLENIVSSFLFIYFHKLFSC